MEHKPLLKRNKRGAIQVLYGYVTWFILIVILLGVGLTVLAKIADEIQEDSTNDKNATSYISVNTTITEVGGYSDWFGIIVIVTVAAVVIGLVTGAFLRRRPAGI